MKCRKVLYDDENKNYNIVYFGSVGLEQPYAVLFRKDNKGHISPEDIKIDEQTGIITNKDNTEFIINTQLSSDQYEKYNITVIFTVDILNKKVIYSASEEGYIRTQDTEVDPEKTYYYIVSEDYVEFTGNTFEEGVTYYETYSPQDYFEISAYYFTKEMYEAEFSSVLKTYKFEFGENLEFNLDILMMSKKWKEDKSSYAMKQEAVASSLIQRLSIIQGELPYQKNYGLPILSKVKDKFIYDSIIINIILRHPDVTEIIDYESKLTNTSLNHGVYSFKCNVLTRYGEAITIGASENVR